MVERRAGHRAGPDSGGDERRWIVLSDTARRVGLSFAVVDAAKSAGLVPDKPHPGDEDGPQQWRRRAACAGVIRLELFGLVAEIPVPTEWFFPDVGDDAALARRICAGCPVREECLRSALANHEEFGIWGGAGGNTRRIFARLATVGDWTGYRMAVRRHFDRLDELAATGVRPAGAQISYGEGATHGKASTYGRGCRCVPCREGKLAHEQEARERRRQGQAS